MPADIDQRIADLAAGQHGVVTTAQLLSADVTRAMIRSRLGSGRLVRLHRGVYLLGALAGDLEPAHAREMAAVLACGPAAVVSHRSAGRLWKLLRHAADARPAAPERTVDVLLPDHIRRRRPGVHTRRTVYLPASDITTLHGIPVTTPERTLRDLSTVIGARELNRAAARAERQGLVSSDDLANLAAGHGNRPGAPMLRAALGEGRVPELTRSKAEERLLALVRSGRLPIPETNVVLKGYEVDFLWRDARLIVEVDGFAYHASRRRFEGDRRRDTDLAVAGFHVLRVTWRQLVSDRDATLARLAATLARTRAGL